MNKSKDVNINLSFNLLGSTCKMYIIAPMKRVSVFGTTLKMLKHV